MELKARRPGRREDTEVVRGNPLHGVERNPAGPETSFFLYTPAENPLHGVESSISPSRVHGDTATGIRIHYMELKAEAFLSTIAQGRIHYMELKGPENINSLDYTMPRIHYMELKGTSASTGTNATYGRIHYMELKGSS